MQFVYKQMIAQRDDCQEGCQYLEESSKSDPNLSAPSTFRSQQFFKVLYFLLEICHGCLHINLVLGCIVSHGLSKVVYFRGSIQL